MADTELNVEKNAPIPPRSMVVAGHNCPTCVHDLMSRTNNVAEASSELHFIKYAYRIMVIPGEPST